MRLSLTTRRALKGYVFIAPWLIGFALFVASPFIRSFIISFQKVDMLMGFKMSWVGIANYKEAFFVDERFVPLLLGTIRNSIIDVPIILVFSLVVAFLCNQDIRGAMFFRAIFFLPVVIASGLVVEQLFHRGVGQELVSFMRNMDVAGIIFIYFGSKAAQFFVELMNRITLVLWRSGVQILIFLAGLQGISPTLYEAAKVDGASDWASFWKITLPMLSPIILVNVIYTIVDSYTDIFNAMLNFIKNAAFTGQFRLGYAAALGWTYFIIIFVIIAIVFFWAQRWVFYSGER